MLINIAEQFCLSKRETEVVHHLIRGKSARVIAQKLCISQRTVEQHLENIKKKLFVNSKAQLVEKIIDIVLDGKEQILSQ